MSKWKLICAGFNLKNSVKPNGLFDCYEIRRLNARHKAIWERGNNSDSNLILQQCEAKQERIEEQVKKICKAHRWKVDMSGGLWWKVTNSKGIDITLNI